MTGWQNLINQPGAIIADGAMGTMLQQAGLKPGELPTLWNVEHADRVRAVHGAYIAAGAQILLTNTFSGNRFCLAKHGLASRIEELNMAGAQILRAEIEAQKKQGEALVAGDIGPSGELLAPLGALSFDEAVEGLSLIHI